MMERVSDMIMSLKLEIEGVMLNVLLHFHHYLLVSDD